MRDIISVYRVPVMELRFIFAHVFSLFVRITLNPQLCIIKGNSMSLRVLTVDHSPCNRISPQAPIHLICSSFIREMREYMPGPHRAYLTALEKAPALSDYIRSPDVIANFPSAVTAYNQCVAEMSSFRSRHIQMVSTYIIAMASRTQCGSALATRGTGGMHRVMFVR